MVSATPKNTPCMVKWKSPYLQSDVSLLFASNAERNSSQQLTMLFSAPRLHWTVVRMSWLIPWTLFEFTLPQWYTNKTSSFDISPRREFNNGSSFTQVFTWLFRQAVSFPYSLLQRWIRCCVSILGPGGHLREVWVEVCQDCAAKTFKPWPFSKAPRFSHTCLHDCWRQVFSFPYSLEQRWSESDVASVFKAPGEHLRELWVDAKPSKPDRIWEKKC